MKLLPPPRPERVDRDEWMDDPGCPDHLLDGAVADLGRVNRWLGGRTLTRDGVRALLGDAPTATIVDVGSGGADVQDALTVWAATRGMEWRMVATDLNARALRGAVAKDGVGVVVADGRALPFADDAVDVATTSLAVHHLGPTDVVRMLREMARIARRGIVVDDLVRAWHSYWFCRRCLPFFTRNPVTRHDAPTSVLRAYTRAELTRLAHDAGVHDVRFRGWMGYRVAMVGRSA